MQKILVGVALALLIIGGGTYALSIGGNTASSTTQATAQNNAANTAATTSAVPSTTGTATKYTLADVATHSTQSSCWTAINGTVYDVTNWISQHPGGAEAILGLCGKDGSDAFNGKHGGQARPAAELATFLIGTLSN